VAINVRYMPTRAPNGGAFSLHVPADESGMVLEQLEDKASSFRFVCKTGRWYLAVTSPHVVAFQRPFTAHAEGVVEVCAETKQYTPLLVLGLPRHVRL
jgi:hypothetical protein